MEEILFLVKEDELDGGFIAESTKYSIITEADTIIELKEMIKEAIFCHFDDEKPRVIRLHYSKDEVFAI